MSDLNCPYCDADIEVCHDDGFGYAEDRKHEMECWNCDKNFTFQTSLHYRYKANKADCLNGEKHELEKVWHAPELYPDWSRCKNCDYEKQGEFSPPTAGESK